MFLEGRFHILVITIDDECGTTKPVILFHEQHSEAIGCILCLMLFTDRVCLMRAVLHEDEVVGDTAGVGSGGDGDVLHGFGGGKHSPL